MKITKYLTSDSILIIDEVENKWKLLERMLEVAGQSRTLAEKPAEKKAEVREVLFAREKDMPTVMGSGFAFPHARVAGLERPVIVIAVLKKPVSFESKNNEMVSFACMAITPLEDPTIALKVMSQICKYFGEDEVKKVLLSAESAEQIFEAIDKANIELDITISARDIMHPPVYNITQEISLHEVTRVMSRNHLNAVAVVDNNRKIKGHITCDRLFHFGLPDFFSQLKSVSFINEFDPFEKYFYEEAHSSAATVMTDDFMVISPETTLLEIVFALTTLRQPKLYVVENDILCGVIDQGDVLDQIINF